MYLHFLKKHGLRFFGLLFSIAAILFVMSYFIDPTSEERQTASGELIYYGSMFTLLIIAGVCFTGFNNRMIVFLGVFTTLLEVFISELILAYQFTLNTYVMTWYLPSLITVAIFHYRVKFLLMAGDLFIRIKPTRKLGFLLLEKTEDTNMGSYISAILKLFWFGYLAISVYYHYFFWHFGIHPQGPLLHGYRIADMEATLNLPIVSYYMTHLFNLQTYLILFVLLRSTVQEYYVKDLTGKMPHRINLMFQSR